MSVWWLKKALNVCVEVEVVFAELILVTNN